MWKLAAMIGLSGIKREQPRMEPIRDLAVRIGDLLLQGAEMMREPLDFKSGGENIMNFNNSSIQC